MLWKNATVFSDLSNYCQGLDKGIKLTE